MRKPAICICKNKDADQLRSNRKADKCLCFRYKDSTIPLRLLSKSKISSLEPFLRLYSSVLDLFRNHLVGFLMRRLKCSESYNLCFRTKIRKNVYFCKLQYKYIEVGIKRVYFSWTCYLDVHSFMSTTDIQVPCHCLLFSISL